MITCIILDDEPFAHQVLEHYIAQTAGLSLVGKYRNAVEAFEYLNKNKVDILFLDIEMPLVNGITFLKALTDPPVTIFTTAYKQYAFEGFELHAVDYLLKPFAYDRFEKAIEKTGLLKSKTESLADTILVKDKQGLINLKQQEILYIEGLKDYIKITTTEKEHVIYHTLKSMLEKLDPKLFVQVHRSFLVNKQHINRIAQDMLVISNQTFIPIGKSYKKELLQQLKA
jgi:two-component system response regulator LytT